MDPRLWDLLKLPPGELYIHQMWLNNEGSTVTLLCEVVNETCPEGKTFSLSFRNCRDVRWQSMDPNNGSQIAQALGVYLGEQAHHKPAVVYTGSTEMTVLYNEVRVDFD